MLDMGRIESGKMMLSREAFRWPELLDETLALVRGEVRRRGHSLSVHMEKMDHESVMGDRTRIQQVFLNLLNIGRVAGISCIEKHSTLHSVVPAE